MGKSACLQTLSGDGKAPPSITDLKLDHPSASKGPLTSSLTHQDFLSCSPSQIKTASRNASAQSIHLYLFFALLELVQHSSHTMPTVRSMFVTAVAAFAITKSSCFGLGVNFGDNTSPALLGRQAFEDTTVIAVTTVTVQGSTVTIQGGTVTVTADATDPGALTLTPPATSVVTPNTGTAPVETGGPSVETVVTITLPVPTSSLGTEAVTTITASVPIGSESTTAFETLTTIPTVAVPTSIASGGFTSGLMTVLSNNGTLSVSMTPMSVPTSGNDSTGESDGKSSSSDGSSSSSSKNAGAIETGAPFKR